MSLRKEWVSLEDARKEVIPVSRQCTLLKLNRSTVYRPLSAPAITEEDQLIMRLIDEAD
jgi:hypothetical protein